LPGHILEPALAPVPRDCSSRFSNLKKGGDAK
jgi:hypothetical protein